VTTLQQLCATALLRPNDQAAIEFQGHWVSWGDLRRIAEATSTRLQECGISSAADIPLIARNQPAAIAVFLGLLSHGYNIRMIYPFQSEQSMATDLEHNPPAAVLAMPQDLTGPVFTTLEQQHIAGIAFDNFGAGTVFCPSECRVSDKKTAQNVTILSSGTTGKPKPISLSYTLIANDIVGPIHASNDENVELPPSLLYFPLGNISGLYTTLPPLLRGLPVILLERFSLEAWHEYVLRYRPTVSGLPPAAFKMLLDTNIPKEDLSSLRYMGAGAAPLDVATQIEFEQRYGIPVMMSYGATEFGGPVTRMTPQLLQQYGNSKTGSVGKAIDGVELRIIDTETGKPVDTDRTGRLEVKVRRMGEHWIRTTDLAKLDCDGFLYHQGREDGAIIRGGFKILPETIESALLKHPAISATAVVGIDDKRLGQVPVAALVFKDDSKAPSDRDLEDYLRQTVLATHIPVAWRRVKELPRTPLSYKVDQSAVRQLFEQQQQQ
jgi:long-chain acyl-CoA synthetase